MKFFNIVLLLLVAPCLANDNYQLFSKKLTEKIPDWMKARADLDLTPFRNRPPRINEILQCYETSLPNLFLVKFTVQDNRIYIESKAKRSGGIDYRIKAFEQAFITILKTVKLPDTIFLISMHDSFTDSTGVPVFAMCKREVDHWAILLPDFEALREKFQVLPNRDITVYVPPWKDKRNQLVWRGSTAQDSFEGESMRPDNVNRFSRVLLCHLSQNYPDLIDAKFTLFAQGGEKIPFLQNFRASQMTFDELVKYKYQLFIDGNVSPYSASGWKFFTNSLIFKPDSPWIQWYYDALKPFEHYIPVKKDLTDLIEKILWARSNDSEAMVIAKNCREFALSHITLSDNLLYLYYIITEYSRLLIYE